MKQRTRQQIEADRKALLDLILREGSDKRKKAKMLKKEISVCLEEDGYRLVAEGDIKPGAKMLVCIFDPIVGVTKLTLRSCVDEGKAIQLNEHCLANGAVYYHIVGPGYEDKQCHVPEALMLGGPEEMMAPICIIFVVHKSE